MITYYEVGGSVRDGLMGLANSDVDYTVIAPSWQAMLDDLTSQGFRLWQVKPEYYTVRAGVPDGHPLQARTKDADFVWARKDGTYTDGRRPDAVEPGTLYDDLERRDFTMNALAVPDSDGHIVDYFGGMKDIEDRIIRFIGDADEKIAQDALRAVRALRLSVTKGMTLDWIAWNAVTSVAAAYMLENISKERISDEWNKMLAHSTLDTLGLVRRLPMLTVEAMLPRGLRFAATLRQ